MPPKVQSSLCSCYLIVRQARLHSFGGERVNFDCFHGVSKLAASNKASGEMGEFYVNMYGLGAFSVACYKASAKRESRILVRCSFSLVSMLLRSWFGQAFVQDGRNARHLLMPPNVAPSDCCLHTWVLILRCSGLAYIGSTCKSVKAKQPYSVKAVSRF